MKLNRYFYLLVAIFSLTACNDVVEKFTSSSDENAESASESKDETDGVEDQLKAEKKELASQIDQLEKSLENEDSLVKQELEVVGNLDEVRNYSNKVEAIHAGTKKALEEWRQATRNSFKGVKLAKIETIGGAEYSDVTITNVTDDTLSFEHSAGMETIDISELGLQLRRNLIHEPTVMAEREM